MCVKSGVCFYQAHVATALERQQKRVYSTYKLGQGQILSSYTSAPTHPFVGFRVFYLESNMFSGKNLVEIPIITEQTDSILLPPPHPHAQLRAFQAPAIKQADTLSKSLALTPMFRTTPVLSVSSDKQPATAERNQGK